MSQGKSQLLSFWVSFVVSWESICSRSYQYASTSEIECFRHVGNGAEASAISQGKDASKLPGGKAGGAASGTILFFLPQQRMDHSVEEFRSWCQEDYMRMYAYGLTCCIVEGSYNLTCVSVLCVSAVI